jgi:hypothetical protein
MFDEFIAKGGEYGHKIGRTLANWVDERSNMINNYHGVLDLNFKLCAFVVNGLIKGEIEKPSGLFLGLIVMSH